MNAPVVGRFAPTPSGRLHLGNLLCCLLAYLSARSAGGRFLLRIEDVDVPRCPRTLSLKCIEDLEFLGFTWDEPPLFQSERTDIYRQAFSRLEALGLIYPCFCTRAQLHAAQAPNLGDREPVYSGTCAHLSAKEIAEREKTRRPAMRMRLPDETVSFIDRHYGPYSENLARDTGDFIICRSDGLFGYQLAAVVDDALSGVNEIVRGRDILASTARQIYMLRTLDFPAPEYAHIPLLMDCEGRRLAKRDKDLSLDELRKRFTAQELLGMLAYACGVLPEWRPASLEELIAVFDWRNVKTDDMRLPPELTQR